ncbi:MAG TPA: energy transducer TonB [Candidatus Sulfopaludibacter sp.]|jgi:hypothetical protein|nr:energy transducer TonB [Candidatus Sulfopaludibacter sp.]
MRDFPKRIRFPRNPSSRSLSAAGYQNEYRIAWADPEWQGIEGTVTLDAVIGNDGIIQTLEFHGGAEALSAAAIETVRHWTYRPVLLNGRPVEVATEIDVVFQRPEDGN